MNITPHMVAGAYEYLRQCPPFKGWNLPDADLVEFRIIRNLGYYGYFQFNKFPTIGVNDTGVGHTDSLMKLVAHEMIHMYQYFARLETKGAVHNENFQKLADRVCKAHGWDSRMFFI